MKQSLGDSDPLLKLLLLSVARALR